MDKAAAELIALTTILSDFRGQYGTQVVDGDEHPDLPEHRQMYGAPDTLSGCWIVSLSHGGAVGSSWMVVVRKSDGAVLWAGEERMPFRARAWPRGPSGIRLRSITRGCRP